MAEYCSTDPTAGCDNSQLVNAINACCSTTNSNIMAGNTLSLSIGIKLDAIETKMDTMIGLLEDILAAQ